MCSPPDSVAVLQQLLRLVGAKKVIEVGVFTGACKCGKVFFFKALALSVRIYSDSTLF